MTLHRSQFALALRDSGSPEVYVQEVETGGVGDGAIVSAIHQLQLLYQFAHLRTRVSQGLATINHAD